MKRTIGIMMTALLLLAATGTKADNYTGTVERFGEKMKYTISGGIVTNKEAPTVPLIDRITSPNSKAWGLIWMDVEVGQTVVLTAERLKGTSELYKKCEVFIGEGKAAGEGKATLSMRVTDKMKTFSGKVIYYGKNSILEYNIAFTVKKKVNQAGTGGVTTYRGTDEVRRGRRLELMGTVNYSFTGRNFRTEGDRFVADYYPGETVTVTAEFKPNERTSYRTYAAIDLGGDIKQKTQMNGPITAVFTIPKTAKKNNHYSLSAGCDAEDIGDGTYHNYTSEGGGGVFINIIEKPSGTTNFKWDDVVEDNNCEICGSEYSEFRPHGYSMEATSTCTKDPKQISHEIEPGKVIYGNTRIRTREQELGIDHGDQENAIIIEKDSEVEFTNDHGVQIWTVIKGGIRGINLKPLKGSEGNFLFYTPHIKAIPFGTVFVIQNNNNASRVYLLSGSMEVTSKKTSKKVTLKPGQASSVSTNGEQKVQQFDIKKAAKKFGISEADLQGTAAVGTIFTDKKVNYKIISTKTVEVTSEVRGIYSGKVKIPAKVKYNGVEYSVVGIGKKAFADQTKLTSIVIPTSIRGIAEDAFLNTGLTEVTIPGDKVSVVKNAFRNCLKLTTVTISGNEPACSPDAFTGCSAMKELRIKGISESNNGKKLNGTNAIIKVLK